MLVAQFLKWIESARVFERSQGATALARAYVQDELDFEERCSAEAVLTLLLDDPSSKVRQALAEALSMSNRAPPQVIAALAADQPDVAAVVLARSPLLTDNDLIERVTAGPVATQELIAARPCVTMKLSAAIAEIAEERACIALLDNHRADIASASLRRMAERLGSSARLRERLIRDARLPADSRHGLLVQLGEALKRAPLVRALMGEAHAERVTRNACVRSCLTLIERTDSEEYPALIEHIRLRGDLNAGLLVRAVAHGKIDFFGAALVALTGQGDAKVSTLLASGFDTGLCALFSRARLSDQTHTAILCALKVWRQVARGKRIAGPQEVSWLMLNAIGGSATQSDLATLLKSIHLDALRANAREHALAITAAA